MQNVSEEARNYRPIITHVHHSIVCAMSAHAIKGGIPTLFRSYESLHNRAPDCTIVEAVRATTARPGVFKPVNIEDHGVQLPYIDGGLGCNNPTACMLDEAKLIFPDRYAGCVISVGTGQSETASVPIPGWIQRVLTDTAIKAMKSIATDCDRVAQDMYSRFQDTSSVYFRFNVEQGLQRIGMSDFNRLSEVVAHTRQYNKQAEVNWKLNSAAVAAALGNELVATDRLGQYTTTFWLLLCLT
jgi:patatin-like phospholipase/acyl hydrolase